MAIFERCQYDLVCDEARILYARLADDQQPGVAGQNNAEQTGVKKEPFDISRMEAVSNFAAIIYKDGLVTPGGKFTADFIRFSSEEHSLNVLRCIFSEFIELRDKVAAYLLQLVRSEKIVLYTSTVSALGSLCVIDAEYFKTKVAARLLINWYPRQPAITGRHSRACK